MRLKKNIKRLYELMGSIPGCRFDLYVISAGPQEIVESALRDSVPADHIHGTQFLWDSTGRLESIIRTNAGYGKIAVLDDLQEMLQIKGPSALFTSGMAAPIST